MAMQPEAGSGDRDMASQSLRNSHGQIVEVEAWSATDAKNAFGELMNKAIAHGIVAITRRDKTRAVLLSVEEYQALLARVPDELETLRGEFDALAARMQKPRARAAGQALFRATPAALGKAAAAAARKRG
jgi:prevent-host-death family protein